MNTDVLFSSKSPHWPTPKALYLELDNEFHFDFDPCPLNENEQDGSAPMFSSWKGKRVFCNPPYNDSHFQAIVIAWIHGMMT